MPDQITATGAPSTFKVHEAGQFVAQCVDVIDLGEKVQDFPGSKPYLAPACAIVFRTGEKNEDTGEYIDLASEFTVSMGEKANLRKFLAQWRGRPYTTEEITQGVPLHKLPGNHGLLTVAHRESKKGKTYANITACVGIPKQMAGSVTKYENYVRDGYWETKKLEYAAAAGRFRGEQLSNSAEGDDFPSALQDGDDDLPF